MYYALPDVVERVRGPSETRCAGRSGYCVRARINLGAPFLPGATWIPVALENCARCLCTPCLSSPKGFRVPVPARACGGGPRVSALYALLLGAGMLTVFGVVVANSHACATKTAVKRRTWGAFAALHRAVKGAREFDWRGTAAFRVTQPMRISIALSLVLGVLLGVGVGVLSGLEPSVVIGVSASMALGCVFVMSFAIVHGVNVLRATCFAIFVSACLPAG